MKRPVSVSPAPPALAPVSAGGTRRGQRLRRSAWIPAAALMLAAACSGEGEGGPPDGGGEAPPTPAPNAMAGALANGGTVFVIRPSELTPEQGAWVAGVRGADYVFTTLERGPWDIPALRSLMEGMEGAAGAGPGATPVLLRIPPLHETDPDTARARVREALDAGVAGIIFPHVVSVDEIRQSLDLLGEEGWPRNPRGNVVAVHMIEDRPSVENARELATTPGVEVVFLGPMSLGTAYEGDSTAVEGAIQSVLAVCRETGVACGITAGIEDVATRVRQGFRFLVVREQAVLDAGRAATGRTN